MLLSFEYITKLENKLKEQKNTQKIIDYRMSLKTDMRLEVFVLVSNTQNYNIESLNISNHNISLKVITEREKNYDPMYQYIFSNEYPSPDSKIDLGLVWRFDTLLNNTQQEYKNPCNVVTFYSYKGGMGRTTTLCTYALHLAQKGKKVVILDCDFEAPGFLSFFNLDKQQEQTQKNGIVEYLLDKEFVGSQNINIKNDYILEVGEDYIYDEQDQKNNHNKGKIFVLLSGNLNYTYIFDNSETEIPNTHLDHYLHGLARLNISNSDKMIRQFRELFNDLVKNLELTEDDYILIDSRTGFNEIFGITALNLSNVIVGFFGSSEQTRAGLYFLLDKYQEIRPQPKMLLVNSIVPNHKETSELFKNSFNQLITIYREKKDGLAFEINTKHLRENKILKEIGVKFYEENEKNQEKEKQLIRLVQENKFKNIEGIEEDFNDLSEIFGVINEFTNNIIEDKNISLEYSDLRKIILDYLYSLIEEKEGNLKLWAELGEVTVNTFFYRECMKKLFDKNKFIIQGFKGSGKTYLYRALKDKEITSIILKKSGFAQEKYEFVNVIALEKEDMSLKEMPFKKEEIRNDLQDKVTDFWKIYMWASIMLDIKNKESFDNFQSLLNIDIIELSNLIETERKIFFKRYLNDTSKIILVEKDLEKLNSFLKENELKLFVSFDNLDKIANPNDWGFLITPLIDFWTSKNNKEYYDRFYPKIFLRNDIIDGHIRTNNPRSIKEEYAFAIDWGRDEMYAYFFKLIFSEKNSYNAFLQILKNTKGLSEQFLSDLQIHFKENNQINPDVKYLQPLLNIFFDKDIKSPGGGSLGNPYTFFFLNFSNANETISIRPFINLISGAVKLALNDVKNTKLGKPILHYEYHTNYDVRNRATELHFKDLTQETGDELNAIKDYIKNDLEKNNKLKYVVLTFNEMNDLLDGVINSSYYKDLIRSGKTNKIRKDLEEMLIINGIVRKEDNYKVFRFAQMYKYWLGLSSREAHDLRLGQIMQNEIHSIYDFYGFVTTGYKSPNLHFRNSDVIGNFNELKKGDLVEFKVDRNSKGFCAKNIKKLNK